MTPSLHFRPLRPAVAADGPTTLELLIQIATPPLPPAQQKNRPGLNLALVIDRSGSMAGSKISYARKAARFLAGELTDRDRLAIITFDDEVQVLVPSQPVRDPLLFISAINTIDAGGCTALFDGWLAGATQVANQLDPQGLNRVLLLSDGQANAGLTEGSPSGASAPVPLAWAAGLMKTCLVRWPPLVMAPWPRSNHPNNWPTSTQVNCRVWPARWAAR